MMIRKIITLQNIIGILFLCLGSLIFYVVLIATKDVNLFNLESWRFYVKFYTLIVGSIFFLLSSILSFLNKRYYIYIGNIALTMFSLIVINKIIEIVVFDFDDKSDLIGYIIVLLIYLIFFWLLNSKKNRLKYKIKIPRIIYSVIAGIIITIPLLMDNWKLNYYMH